MLDEESFHEPSTCVDSHFVASGERIGRKGLKVVLARILCKREANKKADFYLGFYYKKSTLGFPGSSAVKSLLANAGDV